MIRRTGEDETSRILVYMAARFVYASDQSILVVLGEGATLDAHHRVLSFVRVLEHHPIEGVVNLHPAYCSVLVRFDALRFRPEMENRLAVIAEQAGARPTPNRESYASRPVTAVTMAPTSSGLPSITR